MRSIYIVGCGLTGSLFIPSLAAHLVSTSFEAKVTIVDYDKVEARNSPSNLGIPGNVDRQKVDVMSPFFDVANIQYATVNQKVTAKNLWAFTDADIIIGAVDNNETRALLREAADLYNIPYLDRGVSNVSGLVSWYFDGNGNMPIVDKTPDHNKQPACELVGNRAMAAMVTELAVKSLMIYLRGHDPSNIVSGMFGKQAEQGMMIGWMLIKAGEYMAKPIMVGGTND